MTITNAAIAIASRVCLRLDGDLTVCQAWVESAERTCGKPADSPWVCQRHLKIAQRRAEKDRAPVERADAGKADWYAAQIAATERRIARRERAIERFENYPRPDTSDALAAINAPLKQRQRGMAGELKAYRAYEHATCDLPAARARLAWLRERNPS